MGGGFTLLGGQTLRGIGRLNEDGTIDSSFVDLGANAPVYSLGIQTDGKILAGGNFTSLGGQPRNHLARLNADGTLDSAFDPGPNGRLAVLSSQADGKILVGGEFNTFAGQTRSFIARLNNTEPATDALHYPSDTVVWLRGGTAPEAWRTTFEHATDGTNWSMLGSGTRIPGGWQLNGVNVTNGSIRARAYLSGGIRNGSGSIVETVTDAIIGASDFQLRLSPTPGQPTEQRLVFGPCWTNRTYAPLFSTHPAGTPWTNLVSCVTNDHGTERVITDLDATESTKFYRLQVTRP